MSMNEANNDSNGEKIFKRVQREDYTLSYTIFIIPEMASFELTGDLVDLIPQWLDEICESNGWKLEFVTVNPNYLHWALSISVSVSTVLVIHEIRTELTKQIRTMLQGKIKLKDPTDLWAQGYLLLYGIHTQQIEIIEQYIRMIRDQQRG